MVQISMLLICLFFFIYITFSRFLFSSLCLFLYFIKIGKENTDIFAYSPAYSTNYTHCIFSYTKMWLTPF